MKVFTISKRHPNCKPTTTQPPAEKAKRHVTSSKAKRQAGRCMSAYRCAGTELLSILGMLQKVC